MMDLDEELGLFEDAGDRTNGMGLHPSHRWVIPRDGDCWHGYHSTIECAKCGVIPFRECYFDLPYDPKKRVQMMKARHSKTKLAALQPCPGERQ